MSNYVNREDIDRLISMVNDIDIALKKQGVNNISELVSMYYDQSDIDISLNAIDDTVDKANKLIKDAEDKLSELTDDKVNVTDFETYQGQVTDALGGKSDEGHKHPISDVNDLQTTLDGKAPKNHRSTATTYGVSTDSYYGHSKASNSTPSADTVNGGSGTANGIYANANHTHPQSSIYAQASHQHGASDVLYTIKNDLLWTLINTTIDKNLNGETLTGIYSVVNTKFNLSTAQSTSHTNNKYYIVYTNTTTDITTALSTGIDVSADIEDKYIKEMLDTKRNISDWVEATDVRVRVGTLQNDAQTMFNNILYWQSQHEDSGSGGGSSRVFSANAIFQEEYAKDGQLGSNPPSLFNVYVNGSTSFQKGDILIISVYANPSDGWDIGTGFHFFSVGNTYYVSDYDEYQSDYDLFRGNKSKYFTSYPNVVGQNETPIYVLMYNEEGSVLAKDSDGSIDHPYHYWKAIYCSWKGFNLQYLIGYDERFKDELDTEISTQITNKVSTVTAITLNSYATLYVNEATHNCELHYTRSFSMATANTEYTWHSEIIDEKYRPPYKVFGFFIEPYGFLYVNTNGTISGKFPDGFDTRNNTNGRVRWSY